MKMIRHRVNRIDEITGLQPGWGAEIDLRSDPKSAKGIYLAHDPWAAGDDFETWLKSYAAREWPGTLILNTKEDGLEERALELLTKYSVRDFFFLDTALPTLVRWSLTRDFSKFAVRISAYEPLESLEAFKGRVEWVWVDCFKGQFLKADLVQRAAQHFKVCLVSPELQGFPLDLTVPAIQSLLPVCTAVCTKTPEKYLSR